MKRKKRSRYSTGLSFYEDKASPAKDRIIGLFYWGIYTGIAVFLAVVFFKCLGFRVSVLGSSMEPGIAEGQNVLVNAVIYHIGSPERGEIVAFYPGGDEKMHPLVKRVVAIPGDSVQIVNGVLLVNGVPSTWSDDSSGITEAGIAEDLIMLGDNEYFVMGDNPEESEDSRSAGIGLVQDDTIIGRVWLALPAKGSGLHRPK